MTNLQLSKPVSIYRIRDFLQASFPEYNITFSIRNPQLITLKTGLLILKIHQSGKDTRLNTTLNMANRAIVLGTVLGVILGIIGAFVFLGIMQVIKADEMKMLETKVADLLVEEFGVLDFFS